MLFTIAVDTALPLESIDLYLTSLPFEHETSLFEVHGRSKYLSIVEGIYLSTGKL